MHKVFSRWEYSNSRIMLIHGNVPAVRTIQVNSVQTAENQSLPLQVHGNVRAVLKIRASSVRNAVSKSLPFRVLGNVHAVLKIRANSVRNVVNLNRRLKYTVVTNVAGNRPVLQICRSSAPTAVTRLTTTTYYN